MSPTCNIPMVVLPCSADKKTYPCPAGELYLGKGYLPVLHRFKTLVPGVDYHLFFMSAKYGLIPATEVISPYDMKMTKTQSKKLVDSQVIKSASILALYKPSEIIACLPKLYLATIRTLLDEAQNDKPLSHPDNGAGIGSQRGFLKRSLIRLASAKPPKVSISVLVIEASKAPRIKGSIEMHVLVSVGDIITPWLGGVGPDKRIGKPVAVTAIKTISGIEYAYTADGQRYSGIDISFGFTQSEREVGFSLVGYETTHKTMAEKTVVLTEIRSSYKLPLVS